MRCTIALVCSLFFTFNVYADVTLYIAPTGDDEASGMSIDQAFVSLNRAFDEVRTLQAAFDEPEAITINVRGGQYDLQEPVILTPEHSGTQEAPVVVQNYQDEKPVISGGKVITGWKEGKNGVWTTRIREVRRGNWDFRQLYVNGELRRRARIPNEGFLRVAGHPDGGPDIHYHSNIQRFQFHEGDIKPDWTNLDDVEVIVYHFWTDSHLPIESIDTDSNIVKFKHKAGKVFTDDFSDDGARYIVENVYEGLDTPGEWYLNKKTGVLSYIPMEGENMETAEVIAPVIPEFIRFEGEPLERKYVEHIYFQGLSFMYTNWDLPPGNSNDRQGSASVPAAITLKGARNNSFEMCT
ncbi:MAG: hypothetical protein GF372_07600, partial [Candidatus Marinimicrobia bacterium]|nr:hypothetical protein [Candidatus Neomarinimicrobiota bacterium]